MIPSEGWVLTSDGRGYYKVTGVRKYHESWRYPNTLASNEKGKFHESIFFPTEKEALTAALSHVRRAQSAGRAMIENANKDEMKLLKRLREVQ